MGRGHTSKYSIESREQSIQKRSSLQKVFTLSLYTLYSIEPLNENSPGYLRVFGPQHTDFILIAMLDIKS